MKLYTAERTNENDTAENPLLQRLLFAYNEAINYVKGKEVLEIGCGEGYGASILSPYSKKYTGIDKYQTPNTENLKGIEFIQMKVPFLKGFNDNTFDVVVSFQVIEHIKQDDIFISEINRVLKPGGIAILTTPNIEMSVTRNPFHIREYKIDPFRKLLSTKFDNFDIQGVYGDEFVMDLYQKNKESVKKFTRFDIFNLQYNLPLCMLQIPYNIFNRLNRMRLSKSNTSLVSGITVKNYFLKKADNTCLDFFCILKK
ncbi:MAG: methyltransferase domain-containing protein [Bacteroidota bacterium]|nr:methyltransferase domain-containing protein [Bacteroidota bacterium]